VRFLSGFRRWIRLNRIDMELRSFAVGMNSTVDFTEDRHIIMLDYDIKDFSRIERSVAELQSFWNLSDADVFASKNGHHVFFWYDIVPYGRLRIIIDFARDVDVMFKYISRFYDHKTIRVSGKYLWSDIKFVKRIPGLRSPSKEEFDIGELKRREHLLLRKR